MADVKTYRIPLGRRIQEIRKGRHVSQEFVAHHVGLSRTYIGYVEQGKRTPSLVTLLGIAETLDVPVRDFFDFEWPEAVSAVEFDSVGDGSETD